MNIIFNSNYSIYISQKLSTFFLIKIFYSIKIWELYKDISYTNKIKRNKKMYRNNTNPKIINSDIIKETLIFEDNNRPEKKNYSINISYDIFI
jgi:hypothetical protein